MTDTITVTTAALPTTHRRATPKGAQLAKLASLGVATVALCGAVAVATTITHQRGETASSGSRPAVRITGEQALLPDQLDRTLPSSHDARYTRHDPPPAAPVSAAPVGAAELTDVATTDTPSPSATSERRTTASGGTSEVEVAPASDLDLVREFYANLPAAPTAAFGLISSDLLDTSLGEFLRSWSTVSAIDTLDVVQRDDGVLATVSMRLLGGDHLRIRQLFSIDESPRRIVGVQLLSAQRN